ncbi:hypothetical protein ACGFMK_20375 [Amycolatopsis sp. NPDC049252]|uniref:hypothetical protein n=1 Tax=Amycolatopsis sp. NPDC049252 TaxID=3363933 RepID=UPI00372205D7
MDMGDDVAVRDGLRAQLRALVAQREADEKAAAALGRVRAEIAATRRDRDAEMSAEMDAARREIDLACIDAEELATRVGRLWTRVQVAGLGENDPRMHAARRVVEEDFRAAMEAFAEAVNSDDEAEGEAGS